MSRVPFTKLKLTKIDAIKTVTIGENEIEVKQYLPVNDKLDIITHVIEQSVADGNNFANPVRVDVFTSLEIVFAYTNITFTDKQKESPEKLYDLLDESGVLNQIIAAIPTVEYNALIDWIAETIDNFYKQRNSAYGIMESITRDYKDLEFDAEKIKNDIGDEKNITLLKNVMDKLG